MKRGHRLFTRQATWRRWTMRPAAILMMLSFATVLTGCAGAHSLVAGQSSEADVRARMGAPKDTRTEPNGDKLWEYPTGPEGFTTYRVRLGADGRVKEVTELLTEEQFAKITVGKTTSAEVRDLLGRQSYDVQYVSGLGWSWRHLKGGTQPGYMIVSFNPNDTVREKLIIVDQPGDSRDD